ncbi:MAG: hypothetical protein E6G92_10020 [Alphaproteobacteria bacterium]|nr:MAG: hypothetical protein E6G92_10020 [Alphaproteobacteria bacterium]
MNLDDQLRQYFGTADLEKVPPAAFEAGIERMGVDLGLARDPARRFALWALMHMIDVAPDVDVAFKSADERAAARRFIEVAGDAEA